MAANKRPRKPYKAKPKILPVPYRFNDADEGNMQLVPHIEFSKLKSMTADDPTWHTLVARLNIGQLLAHRHFNEEAETICREALDAMVSIRERHSRLGKWGMNGDESKAIGAALNLTDEMQKMSTRRELRDVTNLVYELAGCKEPG